MTLQMCDKLNNIYTILYITIHLYFILPVYSSGVMLYKISAASATTWQTPAILILLYTRV